MMAGKNQLPLGYMAHSPSKSVSASSSPPDRARHRSLAEWVERAIALPQVTVSSRLRGNSLYLLIEAAETGSEDIERAIQHLYQALTQTSMPGLAATQIAPIHRLVLYRRLAGQTKPTWVKTLELVAGDAVETRQAEAVRSTPNAAALDLKALAQAGKTQAISRYLSQSLSPFNIAVRTRIVNSPGEPLKRLLVACEATYRPDPARWAEPIARKLRELGLKDFSDAVVLAQVRGEAQPEWVLRVDLTPPTALLREWVRWGDVQAITQLLNLILQPEALRVSGLLKEATLHLTCYGGEPSAPDKSIAIAAIAPLLTSLAPQGIHGVTVYGVSGDGSATLAANATPETPAWVHWLALPGANQPERSIPPLDLAQKGDLAALTFLLTRLLNPDLDACLATGGIRVQVRQKEDLLHIMTDAPVCPSQSQVTNALARCIKPMKIEGVAGIRVYGRRAGQQRPLWRDGRDFDLRQRRVPEAVPEFAASAAYVSELLEPAGALVYQGGAEVAHSPCEATTNAKSSTSWCSLSAMFASFVPGLQRSLLRTQLFTVAAASNVVPPAYPSKARQQTPITLLWVAAGILLVVQADWLAGRWLQTESATSSVTTSVSEPVASPNSQPLPNFTPGKQPVADPLAFDATGFTQQATPDYVREVSRSPGQLPASPLQPKARVTTDHPSFNSRQLDERFAIYRQYVQQHGTPDVLIVGSSRALRGIDPAALQKVLAQPGQPPLKIFNFGINGATAQVVDLLVRQMLPPDSLPRLIIWADGARAFNSGRHDITFNGIVASQGFQAFLVGNSPFPGDTTPRNNHPESAQATAASSMPLPGEDAYQRVNQQLNARLGQLSMVYPQRDRFKAQLRAEIATHLPATRPSANDSATTLSDLSNSTSPAAAAGTTMPVLADGIGNSDYQGFLPLAIRFNPGTYYQKYSRVAGDYDSDYQNFRLEGVQAEALTNLALFAQNRQIALIFVNLPLTQDYLDPTRRRYEEQFQTQMQRWAQQLRFVYRDLSQSFLTQTDYFSDPSHLNRYGGYAVSQRLAQDALIPWGQLRQPSKSLP